MATIMTKTAARTGTTRFKLDKISLMVSSEVKVGISITGATVPENNAKFEVMLF